MAHLEQQNGRFRVVFRYDRRRFTKALDTDSEQEATDQLGRVRENLKLLKRGRLTFNPATDDLPTLLLSDGRLNAPIRLVPTVTLGQILEGYDTNRAPGKEGPSIETERMHARHLKRIFGESMPTKDLRAKLQWYINERAKERSKQTGRDKAIDPETIKKELRTLSYAWRWAATQGHVEGELSLRRLEWPKGEEKPRFQTWAEIERKIKQGSHPSLWEAVFLLADEIAALLRHAKSKKWPLHYAMIACAAYTGGRRAELMRSRVEDVDFEAGTIQFREKKKDKSKTITFRVLPLPDKLRPILAAWLKGGHPGGAILFCKRPDEPLTRKMADEVWDNVTKNSKWKVLPGFHSLRHSFISGLASKGIAEPTIMRLVGHLDPTTTRRYAHLYPATLSEAIRAVFE